MKLIDLHCDTLWKLMDLDKTGDFYRSRCAVTIPGMKEAGTIAQFFACFTYLEDYRAGDGYEDAYLHVQEMIDYFKRQMELGKEDISYAGSFQELEENEKRGLISAFLTVEEGGVLNGRIDRLGTLYQQGVRLLTPVWNYENCIGYPNSKAPAVMEKGLKPFGVEVIERMGELGMIADVSHASDKTFWDILKYAKGPVVATHSNCRSLCNHPRNLSDEMMRALAEKGGIMGLNFYGPFLHANGETRISYMAEHLACMVNAGGSEFAAIGTDFDGFDGVEILEIEKAEEMERLWEALKAKGFTETQIERIAYGNVKRVLQAL